MRYRLSSKGFFWSGLGLILAVALPVGAETLFRESFSSPSLSDWAVTHANDFKERIVAVSDDGRLRIRADTMGTRDDTVKFLGARLRRPYEVGEGFCIGVTLDWNDQANGSYLTAALVLAGGRTDANPLDLSDWLAVEYVGVPPGRNARLQIRENGRGRLTTLEDEGWPDEERTGRKIDLVRVELEVSPSSLRMWENGKLRHEETRELSFDRVFVHLQVASHSNYRAREVYFDDLDVRRGACPSSEPIKNFEQEHASGYVSPAASTALIVPGDEGARPAR